MCPGREKAREILLFDRKTLKVIVEIITAHYRLRKHLHALWKASEPDCRSVVWKWKQPPILCNQIHLGKMVRETTSPTATSRGHREATLENSSTTGLLN